ncbi:DUF7576 family protein [Haloarcula litorea]|uniref:DUF7576 family protein n=1 Tax=Haloarcula litorea TaxID=3032579 RepID=UPI0023E84719|nr:hypothetical protein [Halomicroarcula sp. GDY20]
MVDPTSDHHEDIDEEEAPDCAVCGEPIANEVTHRVSTRIEDGSVHTVHFCDEGCEAEWHGE